MSSYALHHLTADRVKEVLSIDPRLIWPVGALDHLGPHLPLGSGTLIAERVAADLSDRLHLLVAPTFHFGVTRPDAHRFTGTSSARRKTFHRAVNEILAKWDDHGFQEVIVVTCQRYEPHLEALLTSLTPCAAITVVDLMTIDVSNLLDQKRDIERGGELETSLLLHLAPECVRSEAIRDFTPDEGSARRYAQGTVSTPLPEYTGVVGHPSLGTAEKGRRIYEHWLSALSGALEKPTSGAPPGEEGV